VAERRLLAAALILLFAAGPAGCAKEPDAQELLARGVEHYQEGDFDAAIESFRAVLAAEPGSAAGYNHLGMAYRMKYNILRDLEWKERETEAFRSSVGADSTYWPAHVNLGATLYYLGKKDEAAPFFRKALELFPDNPEREQLEAMIAEGE